MNTYSALKMWSWWWQWFSKQKCILNYVNVCCHKPEYWISKCFSLNLHPILYTVIVTYLKLRIFFSINNIINHFHKSQSYLQSPGCHSWYVTVQKTQYQMVHHSWLVLQTCNVQTCSTQVLLSEGQWQHK